jgi:hypothetical protein
MYVNRSENTKFVAKCAIQQNKGRVIDLTVPSKFLSP